MCRSDFCLAVHKSVWGQTVLGHKINDCFALWIQSNIQVMWISQRVCTCDGWAVKGSPVIPPNPVLGRPHFQLKFLSQIAHMGQISSI